jgi:hypothetical protein
MRLAIMQPYFFPYIGYFQLIAAVDEFVIYDQIKYTKKGWINRNRMLQNGKDVMFSLPLKSGSDYLEICERELSAEFDKEKFVQQLAGAYKRAPYFEPTILLVRRILEYDNINLFQFLRHSLVQTCKHLGVTTDIKTSSDICFDNTLKGQEKVLAICKAIGTDIYINAIGGEELYSKDAFLEQGMRLKFIKSKEFQYAQFNGPFVPWLSILDVMMFNSIDAIQDIIFNNHELV